MSTAFDFEMVCWNFCHAYFLEADLMQILANHVTLSIICHVEIYVDFSFVVLVLGPHVVAF